MGDNLDVEFEPQHFLRCHSKQKNDSADIQTQVWLCAFEPSISKPGRTGDLVATCGGNSVCFVNIKTGRVQKKFFSSDNREVFLTLAWVTVLGEYNYLVAAGSTKTLYFINANDGFCFHEEKIAKQIGSQKPNIGVTSLLFHPVKTNFLYCSASNGKILVMDVGKPSVPNFVVNIQFVHSWKVECEVLTLVYYLEKQLLMATSDEGIYCFYAGPKALSERNESLLTKVLVQFPGHALFLTESPSLVDSVEILENGLIASKCALRGAIYVWNIHTWLNKENENKSIIRVTPLYELKWSDTDNYFMYMGYDKKSKILACGDDKGALWVYNLKNLVNIDPLSEPEENTVQPTVVFEWPSLNDYYSNKKRKLIGAYDIVVNKIALSYNSNYLVAVTSNNMVCIWRKMN